MSDIYDDTNDQRVRNTRSEEVLKNISFVVGHISDAEESHQGEFFFKK